MALSSNPFRPWTWFGKLWSWIFGEQNDRSYYSGASPEHSRGSGTGSTRPGTSNGRPSYYDESGGFYPGTVDSFDSQDSGLLGLFSSDGAIGSLLSSLTARLTGAHLTGAEREANEFTAQQAQINRNFQSAEADLARQWQEEQYLKYNSPAAQMQQFRDAGINPIMVAGGNMPAASTSTAAPSGSAGSSVSPSAPIDMISGIISILKTKAELENIKADTANKSASAVASEASAEASRARAGRDIEGTRGDKIMNDVNEKFAELTAGATYDKIIQEIDVLTEQGNTSRYERQVLGPLKSALYKAQARGLSAEAVINEWRKNYIDIYGSDPSSSGVAQGMSALGTLIDRISSRIRGERPILR